MKKTIEQKRAAENMEAQRQEKQVKHKGDGFCADEDASISVQKPVPALYFANQFFYFALIFTSPEVV